MSQNILQTFQAESDPYIEDQFYYKFEQLELERVPEFLSTWCRFICVRPLLNQGVLTIHEQLGLFIPSAIYGIYLWDGLSTWSPEELRNDWANTIFHEMIHVQLATIGYPDHDEEKISSCAESLAHRLPQVLAIVEDLYPGFSVSERKFGRFFHRDLAPQYIKNVPYK